MTTVTQTKSVLLTEDRAMIQRIERTANEWRDKLNPVLTSWKNLGIETPFSIDILTDHEFKTWFFNYSKLLNPILSAITQDAYQFPDDALMIAKVSEWLRDPETRIEGIQYVKLAGERYELNVPAIEYSKNKSARQFAETENQQRAVELAEKVATAYNEFLSFIDSGMNGNFNERISPFMGMNGSYHFLKWIDGTNDKGELRQRVSINAEQFTNHSHLTQLLKHIK